jgi:hypothetical protein
LVNAREELAVFRRSLLMVNLSRQGKLAAFMLGRAFSPSRTRLNPAITTVVTDAVEGGVIDDHGLVVNIRDISYVYVGDTAVIVEFVPTPLATVKTFPGVAESVINSAIKSDMRTPVSEMKDVEPFVPFPPSGSPEHAHRGEHPRAGHPIIAVVLVPSPIARRPQIARSRTEGLRIYRKGRRGYAYRKEHTDLAEGNCGRGNNQDC